MTNSLAYPYSAMAPALMLKTRILVISDTHGAQPFAEDNAERQDNRDEVWDSDDKDDGSTPEVPLLNGFRWPLPEADVAIHCGDLTQGSSPKEFEATFDFLRKLNAPLKLVIAGNHDQCLDTTHWDKYTQWIDDGLFRHSRAQYPALAKGIIRQARADNVHLLAEGTHDFVLRNGARLRLFASPMTPMYGSWGFQYNDAHAWNIPEDGVDVVATHGPPKGVLDKSLFGARAGCRYLLEAVHRARPRIHCFGHIHEAWGARLVTWKPPPPPDVRWPPLFDEEGSPVLVDLKTFEPQWDDDLDKREAKAALFNERATQRCCTVNLCEGSDVAFEQGKQTLCVNASIMDLSYQPVHLPWLVDVDLPRATDEDIKLAKETTVRILQDGQSDGDGDSSAPPTSKA